MNVCWWRERLWLRVGSGPRTRLPFPPLRGAAGSRGCDPAPGGQGLGQVHSSGPGRAAAAAQRPRGRGRARLSGWRWAQQLVAGLDERGLHRPPLFHWLSGGTRKKSPQAAGLEELACVPGGFVHVGNGGVAGCSCFYLLFFRLRSCVPHTQRSPSEGLAALGKQGQQGQASSHWAPSCARCVVGSR